MPEYLGVAFTMLEALVGHDGFALVEQFEGTPFVRAVGQRLVERSACKRKTCQKRLGVALLLAQRVVVVNGTGAGEDSTVAIGQDRVGQLLPVNHVLTDRVAPGHVPPFVAFGVVLEEEMILAIVVHHAVRIVQPVLHGRKVELRPVLLVVVHLGIIRGDQQIRRRRCTHGHRGRRHPCNTMFCHHAFLLGASGFSGCCFCLFSTPPTRLPGGSDSLAAKQWSSPPPFQPPAAKRREAGKG